MIEHFRRAGVVMATVQSKVENTNLVLTSLHMCYSRGSCLQPADITTATIIGTQAMRMVRPAHTINTQHAQQRGAEYGILMFMNSFVK